MNKFRSLLGLALIVLAVAGLVYWEMDGRERLLTDTVLVAAMDIQENMILSSAMIAQIGVTHEAKISGALGPKAIALLTAKRAKQFIPKNAQLSENFLYQDDFYIKEGESLFVIKPDWISMMSSAIRQGDKVGLYDQDGLSKLGSFSVAFVKDAAIREVRDSALEVDGSVVGSADVSTADKVLRRTDGTSVSTHIEIIATLKDYQRILQHVGGLNPRKIMIIQEQQTARE